MVHLQGREIVRVKTGDEIARSLGCTSLETGAQGACHGGCSGLSCGSVREAVKYVSENKPRARR